MKIFLHTLLACTSLLHASDWAQGSGARGNFQTFEPGPSKWSVALDQNIAWKVTLPETGQSTPVISRGKVFFTTLKPVEADAEVGKDIIAWCCDVSNGKVLWKKEIIGKHPLRLSGCFSDSSAPPAVTDGRNVVVTGRGGGHGPPEKPPGIQNSRGHVVFGDKRSKGSGWGHVAAPSPTVAGNNLYVPVMNGTIHVINWKAKPSMRTPSSSSTTSALRGNPTPARVFHSPMARPTPIPSKS